MQSRPNAITQPLETPMASQKQPERQMDVNVDDAAFEQAFEAARSEMLSESQVRDQADWNPAAASQLPDQYSWLSDQRIGSDRILDEAKKNQQEQNEHDDADELARTAGRLLENVSSDQSTKFQNSNFLSLMRQLRDREVRVEGDKIVDVSMPFFAD